MAMEGLSAYLIMNYGSPFNHSVQKQLRKQVCSLEKFLVKTSGISTLKQQILNL
jgi:hypothetical protein